MTDFSAKRQPKYKDTRRRATRCTRAQDKAAVDNLSRLEVQLGRKIDIEAPVITIVDHKVNFTLHKIAVDSYRIEGIPTLRSNKRARVEENMNSRYNDPPAPSRYYNPRDRDYHDSYYAPPHPHFERRQVAKKSTAQQAQVHQYGHKRAAGPDFNRSGYKPYDTKRPRMAPEEPESRYSRSMRPPSYPPNGVNRGSDSWSRGSSSSRYHQQDHFPRRGPGRPRKDDWAEDGWGSSDWSRGDDMNNRQTRSRSSERSRSNNLKAAESDRSQSQGPSTRGRPKSSQGNDNKSNANSLPKSNQAKSNQVKSSGDKKDEDEAKLTQGSDKIDGQIGTSISASKNVSSTHKAKPSDTSNIDKVKQTPPAIKLKANARKSTYSPGKVKPSDDSEPDTDVEWQVLSETRGSPSPGRKPTTRSDASDDTRQTRSSKMNHVDGRGSALDNALRIERMRKAEEAKNTVEDSTSGTKQPVTNNAPDASETKVDEGNIAARSSGSVVMTRTASRKLMPGPNLARKVSPTSARKTMPVSSNQSQNKPTESTKDASQAQKTSAKQRMARKSAPKSANHQGAPSESQNNEGDETAEESIEQECKTQKATELTPEITKQANGPVMPALAPLSERPRLTARKSAPASKTSAKNTPTTVQQPGSTSSNLPPKTNTDAPAEQSMDLSSETTEPSQSARTVPFKQLQLSKKPGPTTQPTPSVHSAPTARKSAPEQASKKRPEIRMPIQNRQEKDEDLKQRPKGTAPAVRVPVPETKINTAEVLAVLGGKEGVQASTIESGKDNLKALGGKTLSLSIFKKEKLKNIVGKVAAKREAKSASEVSPSSGIGISAMKLENDKSVVDKKDVTDVKESLQDSKLEKDKSFVKDVKEYLQYKKTEVKEQLPEVTKYEVSCGKLQGINMSGVQQDTKNDMEVKKLTMKQETKGPVILTVPQSFKKDSQKDVIPSDVSDKMDSIRNTPKIDPKPVQVDAKVKEIHTGNVASTRRHLAILASKQSPLEQKGSNEQPEPSRVQAVTTTAGALQKPPQVDKKSKTHDTSSNTATTEADKSKSSEVTSPVVSKSAIVANKEGTETLVVTEKGLAKKSSEVTTQVINKSAIVASKVGTETLVVTEKGLAKGGGTRAISVEVSGTSAYKECSSPADTSRTTSKEQTVDTATKLDKHSSDSNFEKILSKDGDQPSKGANEEIPPLAKVNNSTTIDHHSENPVLSKGVKPLSVSKSAVNVQVVKPADTDSMSRPFIDINKVAKSGDPSLVSEKVVPVETSTSGSSDKLPDTTSNKSSDGSQKTPKLAGNITVEPSSAKPSSDAPSDANTKSNEKSQVTPHLSEKGAMEHSPASVHLDKPSDVSKEANEKSHPIPQVVGQSSVEHSSTSLNVNTPDVSKGNNTTQAIPELVHKSAENISPARLSSNQPFTIDKENSQTKSQHTEKSAEGPSPASSSTEKTSDLSKDIMEKSHTVLQLGVRSAVARSPGRKSREGDSSDDALLNSSTNDSAEEPMEVDGDSEMEDYLLADDEVQSKEVKKDGAGENDLPNDISKDMDQSMTENVGAKNSEKPVPTGVTGTPALPIASPQSSIPVDTSKETNSGKTDPSMPEDTPASLMLQNESAQKPDAQKGVDPLVADTESTKDMEKSKASGVEVSIGTPSLVAVSLQQPPKAGTISQKVNSGETEIHPVPSLKEASSVDPTILTQKTENPETNLVPTNSIKQSIMSACQPSVSETKTGNESQKESASEKQLSDNIPNISEIDGVSSAVTDAESSVMSTQNEPLASKGPEVSKDCVKQSDTPITNERIVDSKTAEGVETEMSVSETTVKVPPNEKEPSVISNVTSKVDTTSNPSDSLISVKLTDSKSKAVPLLEKTSSKSTDNLSVNNSFEEVPSKSNEDPTVKGTSEKSSEDTLGKVSSGKTHSISTNDTLQKVTSEKAPSTEDTSVKVASEKMPPKTLEDTSVKVSSEKTPITSTKDTSEKVSPEKIPSISPEDSSGPVILKRMLLTSNTSVKDTAEKTLPAQSTEDVSGKVTIHKTVLPKQLSEDQLKTSRSATPSADSAGESGVDIIELSSDDDATNTSSASVQPKTKKKKVKRSSTELHGSGKSGKRSASPLSDGKENKKAKLDDASGGSGEQAVLSPNLSKQELVAKLIEIKMRQHLKRVNELAARAKSLQDQLTAAENSRQKWQIESTRLQIKVHELNEQNDILRSKRKEVPNKVVITTGTQYDRQDVLQAQQLLASKQSAPIVPTMQTPSTSQRMPQQQQHHQPSATTTNSMPPSRSVAPDASKSSQQNVSNASKVVATPPNRPSNASVSAPTAGSGAKTPTTPGGTPSKQPCNPFGWQQSQPLNLQTPSVSPTAASSGVNATTRPAVPTAKPGDVRAKSSAAKRPSAGNQSKANAPFAVIDLTDDDVPAAAATTANKSRVPLNPVRTPPVTHPSRVPQQNVVNAKSPPVAHSRTTPPRSTPPGAKQSPTVPNILRNKQQPTGPNAASQMEEFRQAAQRQQQQQVQILQRQVPAQQALQQRGVAAQQVVYTSQQARVSPMQSRAVTVTTGGTRQIVSLPANSHLATVAAPQILQQQGQQQQQQVVQRQVPVVQQQIVQQQVVSPGQAAQIIQTPTGQVVMAPMSSGMTTVLAAQPIQAAGALRQGQLTYQIQAVPGQATVQQMLLQQQQQQQQQQPRTAHIVQQQQVATRFTTPTNSVAPSNVQQGGHVVHHRGNSSRPPHLMTRPTHPNAQPTQPPPPYQQQRRPSFSDPGTVRAIAAPPSTAAPSTDVQQQLVQIQTQISQYEALSQSMQQSIQKLKEEDAPFEKRRIEILKELQMGNLGTYRTQDMHMQLRHIQNEQTRIQTESKSKVNLLQQYLHSKHQLQQSLQQHQRQQAVQQSQQQQQAVQQQQQMVQVSQQSRPAVTQISSISTTGTSQSSQVAVRRHPAPLPSVPNSALTVPSNAVPPPKPSLSISKVNQGIVLSWNMTVNTSVHAAIDFYNLYAYQETDAPPNTSLWKKIGEVKALPLPMACTLTQFQPGSMYHFAVCAIDVYHRTGPFSDPSSINLPAI